MDIECAKFSRTRSHFLFVLAVIDCCGGGAFFTKTIRSSFLMSMRHSNLSPSVSSRNAAIPSGIVARSDLVPGRASPTVESKLIGYG